MHSVAAVLASVSRVCCDYYKSFINKDMGSWSKYWYIVCSLARRSGRWCDLDLFWQPHLQNAFAWNACKINNWLCLSSPWRKPARPPAPPPSPSPSLYLCVTVTWDFTLSWNRYRVRSRFGISTVWSESYMRRKHLALSSDLGRRVSF